MSDGGSTSRAAAPAAAAIRPGVGSSPASSVSAHPAISGPSPTLTRPTRAEALVQMVIAMELLLSGRLVPMAVMPQWVQTVSDWLPFQWTFLFPIEVLIGQRSTTEIWTGLGIQLAWMGITLGAIAVVWRRAIRRYTAVGS